MLRLIVDDLTGDGRSEWLTSEVTPLIQDSVAVGPPEVTSVPGQRVVAIDADSTTEIWTATVGEAVSLVVAHGPHGPVVVTGSFVLGNVEWQTAALDGPTGEALWTNSDVTERLYPLVPTVVTVGGQPRLIGSTERGVIRTISLTDGSILGEVPLIAQLYAADTIDVNGDGVADLVVGGDSGAVFAIDSTRLGDMPEVIWRRQLAGPVHKIEVVDIDGDGTSEVVVAASLVIGEDIVYGGGYQAGFWTVSRTGALAVLSATDGTLEWMREFPDEYVWTFSLADLDGDGATDVVVPARSIHALSGRDGEDLWEFTNPAVGPIFSNTAVAPGNVVVAQSMVQPPAPLVNKVGPATQVYPNGINTSHAITIALDGANGEPLWLRPVIDYHSFPRIWRSVVAGLEPGFAHGNGVAVSYEMLRYGSLQPPPLYSRSTLPQFDVLDARDGSLLQRAPLDPTDADDGMDGLVVSPDGRLVFYDGFDVGGTRCIRPDGIDYASAHGFTSNMRDMAWANFGPFGTAIVAATYGYVDTWPGSGPCPPGSRIDRIGGPGTPAKPTLVRMEALFPKDLEGDGTDEVVAISQDNLLKLSLRGMVNGTFGSGRFMHVYGLRVLRVQAS